MAYKNKKNFIFNGIASDEIDLININVDTGMLQEPFLADSTIHEINTKGQTKPYFMKKEYAPLLLNLSFGFLKPWDDELIREVARVFNVDYYKPLYFEDEDDVIYFCMPVETSTLIHNSLQEGYVEMSFRCNDRCAYSRIKTQTITDSFHNIRFRNRGDLALYPIVQIIKDGTMGDIVINNQHSEQTVIFKNIPANERIYMDCEKEIIHNITQPDAYRYNNHNNIFLKLVQGSNQLDAFGIQQLEFIYRFKILQN